MAKVSLRSYDREIENLIDQNRLDEAIAHCRHILQTYPKHLETYRLLGKAYLESKRYEEAVDVFSRVLTAVPDDFVSHVGMSIIRDEQNRLDEAISHMERAFESQPSNAAIQSELRRLFGRRDGMEPPKIRMNRGALAHMYVQGELYPQAISEIRAVLNSDSHREDMKALLARAYFHAGQKADASDICSQLLANYAYSLDANRIMTELMQGSNDAEAAVYRNRVIELDPYAAHSTASVFRSNEVPEVAVSLDMLEYHGQEVEPAPEWRAAGIGEAAPDEQPDWLKQDYSSTMGETPPAKLEPKNDLPDFMRAAGWTAATGAAEEPEPLDLTSEQTSEADLAPGDMPDWLKAMAPQEEPEEPTITPTPPATALSAADMPDWLADAAPRDVEATTPSAPISSEEIPDWLSDMTPREPEVPAAPAMPVLPSFTPEAEGPDWLKEMNPSEPEIPAVPAEPALSMSEADVPDWLKDMSPVEPEIPAAPSAPVEPAISMPEAEVPDWLKDMSPVEPEIPAAPSAPVEPAISIPEAEVPDWLSDMAPRQPEAQAAPAESAAPMDETPDWLKKLSSESETPASDIPDWLENIEAAEPGMAPSSTESGLPDWFNTAAPEQPVAPVISEPEPIEQEFPPMITPVEPLTTPPTLESLGTSTKEQDDAMAWLESLAAKHGAKAEELVTDPNARTDKPPEWVEQARALSEGQPVTMEPPIDDTQPVFLEPEPEPSAETPVEPDKAVEPEVPFMEPLEPIVPGLEGALVFEEVESVSMIEPEPEHPAPVSEELPSESSDAGPALEPLIPETFPSSADETGIWLRSLDEKEISARAESEAAAEFIESIEHAEPEYQAPTPIESVQEETPPVAPPEPEPEAVVAPVEAASDLPDWLQDIDREEQQWSAPVIESTTDDELPAWLQGEAEPSPEAEPTQPTDWRPAESIDEPALTAEEIAAVPEPSQEYLTELETLREQPQEAGPEITQPVQMDALPEPVAETPAALESEPEMEPELLQEAQMEAPRYEEPEATPEPPAPVVSQPVEPRPAPRKPIVRPVAPAFQAGEPALALARAEMTRGDIPSALDQYGKLIRRGKYLEETIHDMREALYRYPVEITIWQTLGDAYMRENRLQEALDAYTKAEELLR